MEAWKVKTSTDRIEMHGNEIKHEYEGKRDKGFAGYDNRRIGLLVGQGDWLWSSSGRGRWLV